MGVVSITWPIFKFWNWGS